MNASRASEPQASFAAIAGDDEVPLGRGLLIIRTFL